MGTWVQFPTVVWDLSLCAPSRASMLTGLRWQRTGVYTDGLAGTNAPQDGSAQVFNYAASGGELFNQIATLDTSISGPLSGSISSITIGPTAEPIMLTAGSGLPGGKIGIGPLTAGVPPTANKLSPTSTTPIFTSTTQSVIVPVSPQTISGGPYTTGAVISIQAYFPQQLMNAPGSPGYFDLTWDWSHSWPWYLKQVGYQTAWFGKFLNSYPFLKGDAYVPGSIVHGNPPAPILDRYLLLLDDTDLGNQTDTGNAAQVVGKPYSAVDHTNHAENNYLATSGSPFFFNNQGSTLSAYSGLADSWNDATNANHPAVNDSWVGSGTTATTKRQNQIQTDYQTDFYNRRVQEWLTNTDGSGIAPQAPFALSIAIRGDHRLWTPALRHWCVTPANIPGYPIGTLDNLVAGGNSPATSIVWTNEPILTGTGFPSITNGTYIMVGAETMQVTSGYQGGAASHPSSPGATWNVTRDVLQDNEKSLIQMASGSFANWPVGCPVLLLSSSTLPDVGDSPSFNETNAGTSPFWNALIAAQNGGGGGLGIVGCVQARHDRIIKAKTGMSIDEMIYDLQIRCAAVFTNPTVFIVISDNGWAYGQHCQASGKITPYKLARQGPIFINWPSSGFPLQGLQSKYPYFSIRPNIVLLVVDDDDSDSLSSGFPILSGEVQNSGRVESGCLSSNLDITATICDLAGATPSYTLDGESLAPIASSYATGTSPRDYIQFSLRQAQENGYAGFQGVQTLDKIYWKWRSFSVPSYAIQPNPPALTPTAAQVPAATYAAWEEGYDLSGTNTGFPDSDETTNAISNTGYTPPFPVPGYPSSTPLSASELAELRSILADSLADVPNI